MGSFIPHQELMSSDCRFSSATSFVPKTINSFLEQVTRIHDQSAQMMKIDEYIDMLEEEMKKINAFRRELPLCMLLINDAIVMMKDELVKCKKLNPEPVLEEFIPLKKRNISEDDHEKDENLEKYCKEDNDVIINSREKMNWMSSVQLWNSDHDTDHLKIKQHETRPVVAPGLSLSMPEIESDSTKGVNENDKLSLKKSSFNISDCGHQEQQNTVRKRRRCWSPELHRRFISALEQLGGPQVATPKQIRELMQVDDLTNDEVKSHLQKYRLHIRKANNNATKGLWTSSRVESLKPSNAQSRSPEGPLHFNRFSRNNIRGDGFEGEEEEKSISISLSS